MKSTGVTRKIDDLGRIVIPKEIRKNLGIRDGESLEIFTEEDSIILKKHSEIKKYEELSARLCELIESIFKVNIIITDRQKVIATSLDKSLINQDIDKDLIYLIDNREEYNGIKEIFNYKNYVTIVPIIASIDSLGLIILLNNDDKDLRNIAKFMAKILSDKLNI
ncbi:MAG: AbrB/MazE/SpoVT family DNA-binding domain-containing protein [Bacilli bacterium]